MVTVDGTECGKIASDAIHGNWYVVACNKGLGVEGKEIKIMMPNNGPNVLEFCGIKVFGNRTEAFKNQEYGFGVTISVNSQGVPYLLNNEKKVFKMA